MYEVFGHTADVGLRMKAADLSGLFAEAGRALFSVMVANPDQIEPRQQIRCQIKESQRDYLLLDWLNELLFTFESKGILLSQFDVHLDYPLCFQKLRHCCDPCAGRTSGRKHSKLRVGSSCGPMSWAR